jgi:DNA processing protein
MGVDKVAVALPGLGHRGAGALGGDAASFLDAAERRARLGLAAAAEAGDRAFIRLVAEHGPVDVWELLRRRSGDSPLARRVQAVRLDEVERETERWGLRFIVPGDAEWPDQLADLDRSDGLDRMGGAPLGLWLCGPGRLNELMRSGVAIVGSRAATAYGEHVTADLAAGLAEAGHPILSGGAYGIDAAAHRAALGVGGRTVAVMAGGLATLYPPGNARLLEQVRADHLIVSEYAPVQHPSRPRFLARNRLIAALAAATVVVEGGVRSGAANTVRWAQSLGRPVLAVPGPVTSALSVTPHRLIRDGEAILVATAEDIQAVLSPPDPTTEIFPRSAATVLDGLDPTERQVFEEVPGRGETTVDDIAARTGLGPVPVLAALGRLSEVELVEHSSRGTWRLLRIPS